MKKLFVFYIFGNLLLGLFCLEFHEEFIPSNEWKTVKPGQKIPEGLHVRMNLKTGQTEAKLLDEKEKSSKNGITVVSKSPQESEKLDVNNEIELKKMLKNIKNDLKQNNTNSSSNASQFRTYEEIKKEFESFNMTIKTDLEIIRQLMANYKNCETNKEKLNILTEFEYMLHQIDNAQNFWDMGGLNLLFDALNSNDNNLKSEALRCLSSALQGNSRIKVDSMKEGLITKLMSYLSQMSSDDELFSRIISTIGSMTRQFPLAQIAFVSAGGLDTLSQMVSVNQNDLTLKLLLLISDWLQERKNIESDYDTSNQNIDRKQQYNKLNLAIYIRSGSWCRHAESLVKYQLKSIKENELKIVTLDSLEKLTIILDNFRHICLELFDNNLIRQYLDQLKSSISLANDGDDYFQELFQLIDRVKSDFNDKPKYKSEL